MATEPLSDAASEPRRRPPRAAPRRGRDAKLVEALRRGDEEACRLLLRTHHVAMVRVARGYVGSEAVAEEVAQEAWVAMFRGLETFEGRSTLRAWLFSILILRARTVGARESRSAAVSQLVGDRADEESDPLDGFFHAEGHPRAGAWAVPPQRWKRCPEDVALDAEVRGWILEAIEQLPEMQRLVMTLRDVEEWTNPEIAELLDRPPGWVRVTLHRARFRVRAELEKKLGVEE